MQKMLIALIVIVYSVSLLGATSQEKYSLLLNESRICASNFDYCLKDMFDGLGSMDGDDIRNCQIARDECFAKIETKIDNWEK